MTRHHILLSLLAALLVSGAMPSRDPYVHTIHEEEGSLDSVSVHVDKAEEAKIFARGYDKWGIPGRKIYIEGKVVSHDSGKLKITLSLTARDLFGHELDKCESYLRLLPEREETFECALLIKDLREFHKVTYKVLLLERSP